VTLGALVAYLAAMALYFYAYWNPGIELPEWADWTLLAGLIGLQLALGLATGRWWAVALPLGAILLAIPAGYGEGVGQEAEIWLYYGYIMAVPGAVLVAVGVGARKLHDRRR
jgi:hypothetical protein